MQLAAQALATTNHDPAASATYPAVAAIANQTSQAIALAFLKGAEARGQQPLDRLEYVEPEETADVLTGEFQWIDAGNVPHTAAFYVRTCTAVDLPECRAKRVDDYNEQLVDQYYELQRGGARQIAYKDCVPSPFF